MTTKIKIGLGGLLIALILLYFYNEDSLPPRTPRKIARLISGLSISRGTELEKLVDIWTPNGDGEVLVKGILTDQELNDLIEDARTKDYIELPIKEDTGPAIILDSLLEVQSGLYKIELDKADPRGYCLTIIDVNKKELITYLTVL